MSKRNRIMEHPILGKQAERKRITFQFNGEKIAGYKGDTIASALLAHGIRTLRHHEETGTPRGIYCNIGHCYECRVIVSGTKNIRACLEPITENMSVTSSPTFPHPLHPRNESENLRTYKQYKKWLNSEGLNDV